MLYNLDSWINDSQLFSGNNRVSNTNTIPKFRYIAWQQGNGLPVTARLDLHFFGAVCNNRPVTTAEYNNTSNRPLSTVRVGAGGDLVTLHNPYNYGLGYSNYTRFINSILTKHKLKSTFYPCGATFPGSTNTYNTLGCNLAITEQFSLTFVEVPIGFPPEWTDPSNGTQYTNTYSTSTIFHIETTQPFSLVSWAGRFLNVASGSTPGFSIIKGRGTTTWSSAINWEQFNGLGLPINP